MNIVYLTQALPYLPARDGFRLYAANLLRALARRHQVDVVSLLTGDDADHLGWVQEHCHSLLTLPLKKHRDLLTPASLISTYAWGKPLRYRQALGAFLAEGSQAQRWDVLHVEGGYTGGLVPNDLSLPRVLSVHDSWKLRCAQMAECSPTWQERLYYGILNRVESRYERLVYPRFDFTVVVAGTDALQIRALVPNCQVSIIPNGIDTDYYSPMPAPTGVSTFVFHGNLEYAPNIQAATEFAREIFPLIRSRAPQAEFHMVGAKPTRQIRELASAPGVRLSADLPDLRSALGAAHVYVCPMRFGTGVKNKLLEAMAVGLPIISYPEAVQGIGCTPGKHLLQADDAQEFARLALDLIKNPRRGQEIGQAARRLVVEEFSWDSRAEAFENLYREAIANRSLRPGPLTPFPQGVSRQILAPSVEVAAGRAITKVLRFPTSPMVTKLGRWREKV